MRQRDKTVIAVLVMIVIAVGGYFVLVKPKHHQADQLQAQIVTAQGQLSQAEAEVQSGLQAEKQYATYAKQLRAIKTAVPSDDQIPELINQLQAASSRNKVGFQTVSVGAVSTSTSTATSTPATGATTAAFPSESFNLSFTGSYFSVARLLGTLASYVRADDKHFHATGRLLSISTLSLSPGGASTPGVKSGNGDVSAAVTATDYAVPASLLPTSSTASSASTATSTGSPAAYITH
jgi:hypothetical protein